MNTTEHLELILAYCRRCLAIAEKRSAVYKAPPTLNRRDYEMGRFKRGGGCISIDREQFHGMLCDDAEFIATCAGASEAGWRATIAAVDDILPYLLENDAADSATTGGHKWMLNRRAQPILAAYPLELIQSESAK